MDFDLTSENANSKSQATNALISRIYSFLLLDFANKNFEWWGWPDLNRRLLPSDYYSQILLTHSTLSKSLSLEYISVILFFFILCNVNAST